MEEHIAHSGAWGLAIIMIVGISWVFYRYVAPKNWHEWASAGVVQAFIIALYAEMYGFPLTIYLLSRFFGLDRGDLNASLWSTLLGMGETGMMISMILGYVLVFFGIGIFFREHPFADGNQVFLRLQNLPPLKIEFPSKTPMWS